MLARGLSLLVFSVRNNGRHSGLLRACRSILPAKRNLDGDLRGRGVGLVDDVGGLFL
jgi:hypothetical protein